MYSRLGLGTVNLLVDRFSFHTNNVAVASAFRNAMSQFDGKKFHSH
jgi:hypothetical protein